MSRCTLPLETVDDLETLAGQLDLADFDLLLAGDGSGTVFDQPAGWACIAYNRRTYQAVLHAGATSCGTNNFAEVVPYIQALWFHEQGRSATDTEPVRVCVLSDSELTVRCGAGQYARRANGCLWSAVEWFERHRYQFTWRHVPRNSNPCNALADKVAGQVRRLLADGLNNVAAESCAPVTSPIA